MNPTSSNQLAEPILVWAFGEAPEEFQKLSGHGGDEDYLAVVPASWMDHTPLWLQMGSFGCCDIEEHVLPDGRRVFIGAHS
jgi:hypothetical protein